MPTVAVSAAGMTGRANPSTAAEKNYLRIDPSSMFSGLVIAGCTFDGRNSDEQCGIRVHTGYAYELGNYAYPDASHQSQYVESGNQDAGTANDLAFFQRVVMNNNGGYGLIKAPTAWTFAVNNREAYSRSPGSYFYWHGGWGSVIGASLCEPGTAEISYHIPFVSEPKGQGLIHQNLLFLSYADPPNPGGEKYVTDNSDVSGIAFQGIAVLRFDSCVMPPEPDVHGRYSFSAGWTQAITAAFDNSHFNTGPYWVDQAFVFNCVQQVVQATSLDDSFRVQDSALQALGRWIPGRLADIRGGRLNSTTGVYAVGVTDGSPMHPTGLTASHSGGTVSLSWNAVGGSGISYLVYQSNVSGGPYTNVGSTSSTTYTQTGVATGTYYYVVSASNGFESGYSDEVSVTI